MDQAWLERISQIQRRAVEDKAVHEDLDATKDAQGTVQMTVSVLRELYNAA